MNNVIHTFKGVEVNERKFDVVVYIEYYWDSLSPEYMPKDDECFPVAEDFHIQEVTELLADGSSKPIDIEDPIRWDILGVIDYMIDDALIGLKKDNE